MIDVCTFYEQLFVISDRKPPRRWIRSTEVQPPSQRPTVVITSTAELVVVFQTLDGVTFNLALHDRPVLRMTSGETRTENATGQ